MNIKEMNIKSSWKDKVNGWLDGLAEWLNLAPKPIPVPVRKPRGQRNPR